MSQWEGLSHILWKINECLKPPIRKIVSLIKVQTLSIYVQHLLIMFSPHVNQCFTVNPAFDSLFPYLVSSETHESIIFPITYKPTQLSGIVWGDHLVYNTTGLLGLKKTLKSIPIKIHEHPSFILQIPGTCKSRSFSKAFRSTSRPRPFHAEDAMGEGEINGHSRIQQMEVRKRTIFLAIF